MPLGAVFCRTRSAECAAGAVMQLRGNLARRRGRPDLAVGEPYGPGQVPSPRHIPDRERMADDAGYEDARLSPVDRRGVTRFRRPTGMVTVCSLALT